MSKQKGERSPQVTGHSEERENGRRRRGRKNRSIKVGG